MKKFYRIRKYGSVGIELVAIMAIFATVSFVSFGSQSEAARDSKRKTDLSNLASKMNIAMANGTTVLDLVTENVTNEVVAAKFAGTGAVAGVDYRAGTINFDILGVSSKDFKDPNNSSYKVGATSNAGTAFQLTATLESDNSGNPGKNALIIGNYSPRTIKATTSSKTYRAGVRSLELNYNQVGYFHRGDYIQVIGNNRIFRVTNVSADLSVINIDSALSSNSTGVQIAKDESVGLVASKIDANYPVTSGSTKYMPY